MSQEVPSSAELPGGVAEPSGSPVAAKAPASGRLGLWIGGAVGLLVLVAVTAASLAIIGDLAARTVEMNRLLTSVEASESAMKQAQDQVNAALEPYADGNMTDAQRQKVEAELKVIATRGQQSIGAAGQQVKAVGVLPWHSKIADAQRAYLRHNAAWVAYMIAASDRPDQWFADQPEVNQSFADAKQPFIQAVTLFDIGNALERIKAIFADESAQDSASSGNTESA